MTVCQAQTVVDLKTQTKTVDFSGASYTKPFKTGNILPAACGTGETFFKLDAPPGQNLYGCSAANSWAPQSSGGLPDMTNNAGRVLSNDGQRPGWQPIGGDVSGPLQNVMVGGLQGRRVTPTAPADGDVLRWNNTTLGWEPGTLQTGINYSKPFVNATVLNIAGAEHKLGHANILVTCYDSATPAARVEPDSVSVDAASFNVVVKFAAAQSGRCVVNGSGVFTFDPTAGGDLSGVLSNAAVTKIQSYPIATTQPQDGQVLTWSQVAGKWQPYSIAGGGGGSLGGGLGLNGLNVNYASSTVLTIGSSCSSSFPCNARFGSIAYSITNSATATLSGGTGTAYFYLTSDGALTIASSLNISCSLGCQVTQGGSFPVNVIPLFTWTATNGTWDATGGRDNRAYLSAKKITSGPGMVVIESGTQTTVAVDSSVVPTYIAGTATLQFPAIPNGACAAELTFSLPGALAGDSLSPGWPPSLHSGLLGNMRVAADDSVSVRLCNLSGASVTPAGDVFRATVVRSF